MAIQQGRAATPPESETRRRVLEMYEADRSAREIAAEIGISVQRVYQHLDRLRQLGRIA